MTPARFRKLALELPEAVESEHMDHPDFRVRGKIFASLGPDEDWGMVKLRPDQQALLTREEPEAFTAFPGAWGRRGCTKVILESAKEPSVREALAWAWRNTAPKKLVDQHDDKV